MGKQQPKKPKELTDEEILRLFGAPQKKNLSPPASTPASSGQQAAPIPSGNGSQNQSLSNPYQKNTQGTTLTNAGPKPEELPAEKVFGKQAFQQSLTPDAYQINTSSPTPSPEEQEAMYQEMRKDIKLDNMSTFDQAVFYGGQLAGHANKQVYREAIPGLLNFLGDIQENIELTFGDTSQQQTLYNLYKKYGTEAPSHLPNFRILADKYKQEVDDTLGGFAYGGLDPDFDNEWYSKLGTSIGQGMEMLLTRRPSAAVPSLVLKSPTAVVQAFNTVGSQMVQPGSVLMGSEMFDGSYQQAKADLLNQGYSEEEASNAAFEHAFKTTLVSQPLESLPFAKMFNRINKATGGLYKNRLASTVANGFEQGVEEATTEVLQQAYQNMDYHDAINNTREITDGLAESAYLGFMSGGVFGSVSTAIAYRKDTAQTPEERAEWEKAEQMVNAANAQFQEKQQSSQNIKDSFGAAGAMNEIQQIVDNKEGNWTPEELGALEQVENVFKENYPDIAADIDRQTSGIEQEIRSLRSERDTLFNNATTPDQIAKAKQREGQIDADITNLIRKKTNIKTNIIDNQYHEFKEEKPTEGAAQEIAQTEAPAVQEGQQLEEKPVTQPKEYKMKVGITSATESLPQIKEYMAQAREAQESGDFNMSEQLYNKVLDIGEQEINSRFKDIPEVKFKLNRTKGNFFGYTEPTFQGEFIVPADKTSQFQERLFDAAESLKQENVHISTVLPFDESAEFGIEQPDGSVYEPDVVMKFTRPITDQEYAELSKELQSIGAEEGNPLAGSTLLPGKDGINLYNISKFKDHGKFQEQTAQLAEALHRKGLLGLFTRSIRKIWNTGNREYGATRTYQERRAEISGADNTGEGEVNDSANQQGIQSNLGIGQEPEQAESIQATGGETTSPGGVLQTPSEGQEIIPPTEPPPASEENPTPKKERKSIKRIMEDPNISSAVKAALSEDTRFYETTSIPLEQAEASAIIDERGLDTVIRELTSKNNQMNDHNFTMLQIESMERLNKQIDEALSKEESVTDLLSTYDDLANALGENATRTAQNLNRYKVFAKMHPLYYLNSTEKSIRKERKKLIEANESSIKDKTEAVNKVNEESVDAVTQKAMAKVRKIKEANQQKIAKATPKTYSAKKEQIAKAKKEAKDELDKLFKDLSGRASAGIDPVLTAKIIAQATKYGYYTIAEGYYDFKEWSSRMRSELGDEVDPYLNDIWKSSFQGDKLDSVAAEVKEYEVRYKTKKAIVENMEEEFSSIVKKHYTEVDKAKEGLKKKLLDGLDITEKEAEELSKIIEVNFNEIVKQKKMSALLKTSKAREVVQPIKTKQLYQKIIEKSNLGALDEKATAELYADEFGMPKLTEQQRTKIIQLSDKVQKAKGFREMNKATQDLLSYQESIKGINWADVAMSVWYANVLSGYKTHIVNNAANGMNIGGEAIVSVIYNPKNFPYLLKGLTEGVSIGWKDAYDTFVSGYDPYKTSKIDTPNILERIDFVGGKLNPANYLKLVRRFMTASDIMAFNISKRMRMYEWSAQKARNEKKNDTTINIENRVNEIMNQTAGKHREAIAQAQQEGIKPKSKEFRRRVFEIMEAGIDENAIEDATDFGLQTTFNENPYGALGYLTDSIAGVTDKASIGEVKPLKFIVPFTKVIANVANSYVNWSPWGYVRAAKGSSGLLAPERYKKQYTETERHKILIKAILGTIAMGLLWKLTEPDEEGYSDILITADGTGDLDKNYQLAKEGWMKYSISPDGGKTWVSYQNTPLYIPLALIGWVRDQERYNGKKMDDKTFQEALFMGGFRTARFITDMTFLQSFSDMIAAYNSNNMEGYLKKLGTSTIKGFVQPNAFSQFMRDYNQYNGIPQKQATTFWEGLYRDIPILNEELYPMVDQLGDDITPDPDRFFSTPIPKDATTEKVWDIIIKNQAWVGRISLPKLSADLRQAGYTGDVTGEQYYRFMKLRGQYIKEGITESMEGWVDFSKNDIKKEVDSIKRSATKEAKYEIFFEENADYNDVE